MKNTLHIISKLSFVFMAIAFYFIVQIILDKENNTEGLFNYFNQALIFLGIGIGFDGLKDTTKALDPLSMKVWSNETSGKIAIYFITIFIISMILFSGFAYYFADNTLLKQVSSGSLVLSISFIGLLKNAIELHENHKK